MFYFANSDGNEIRFCVIKFGNIDWLVYVSVVIIFEYQFYSSFSQTLNVLAYLLLGRPTNKNPLLSKINDEIQIHYETPEIHSQK